jgi:hypothetical protein
MPSEKSTQQRLIETAAELGDQVYRQAYERIGGRAGASPGSAGGRSTDQPRDPVSGSVDLAKDIAGLVLHTAATVAQDVADAAASLDSLVAEHRHGSAAAEAPGASAAGPGAGDPAVAVSTPVALALPAVSPGASTSMPFDVRNDSLETVDAVRLRCRGLFGPGDVRISGRNVKFAPVTVSVAPKSTVSVTCNVKAPEDAKRGHYAGLIEATNLAGVQLLASLDVV